MRAILMVLMVALVALLPATSHGAASISSRSGSTCAVNAADNNKLYCWGSNANCQGFGNCTGWTSYPTPKVTSGVAMVAKYYQGACFVTTAGALKCWGNNATGQLGLDPTITAKTPTPITLFASGIASVAEGWEHNCAVTTGGAVKCWGNNAHGQVGNGSTGAYVFTPVTVIASGAVSVATAGSTSCARMNDNTVKCWGKDHGNASPAGDQLTPTTVGGITGVVSLGAGDSHFCVSTGGVKCWGSNTFGQFGNNTTTSSATPVAAVTLTSGVFTVVGGAGQTCARKSNNTAWCWGSNNLGSLGDGTQTDRLAPTQVSGLMGTTKLTVGSDNACSLSTGGYHCWGDGTFKQNGAFFDGTWPSNPRLTPFAFYFWGGP